MNITERVEALRAKMADRDLEAYIIPTSDPHQSEYVPNHYMTRRFITGFTGSAGTAVVTMKDAALWTDSRYFLQAEEQLRDTPFQLYKMGFDQTMEDFLKEKVSPFAKIGFDGSCMSTSQYKLLSKTMGNRALITDVDYVGDIWEDRPALPDEPAFYYPEEYTGKSIAEKLQIVRYMLKDREADATLIGSLEDVCYLFNIRGWDVEDTPVVLSYAFLTQDRAVLFIDPIKVTDEIRIPLEEAGVELRGYDEVAAALEELPRESTIYLNPNRINISLYQKINNNVKIKTGMNLPTLMKAIKNEVEIENAKKAFLKDGAALVRFFNWVETGAATKSVNERTAVERLHRYRSEQEGFLQDSFPAIIGYGSNAAIVHYDPMESTHPAVIEDHGLLLVDSGGHYWQGSTDITRTMAMGETTEEEKHDYTLVLKSHIAGMTAQFPKGTTGAHIAAVAYSPLYKDHKTFRHGTGHGVGHLLNIHEGPQTIAELNGEMVEFAPGMVTSMEPGLYIAGSHGIRTESITLCVEEETNDFGTWYGFESLTWVPIDTRPVDVSMLEPWELEWLNHYNATCEEKLGDLLKGDDRKYLAERCKPLAAEEKKSGNCK